MTYLAVNRDGSTAELGNITGYRVAYRHGRRQRQSPHFPHLWQAFGFQKRLQMGQQSRIIPVYSKGKPA
jgi:hypothetical protein